VALTVACGTSGSPSLAATSAPSAPSGTVSTVAFEPEQPNLSVVTREIKQARKNLHGAVDVKYPELKGIADGKVQKTINDKLRADADAAIAQFFEDLQKNPPEPRPGTDPEAPENTSSLDAIFQPVMLGPTAVSFRQFLVHYPAGAAHPTTALQTYSFNLADGHLYTLAELFKPGANYLGRLSELSRKLLPIEIGNVQPELQDGTAPKPENFEGWALTPDGIEITFGQYQVGPYALGMPRILILASALSDLARDGGPI
jgi:hypothetical protein